MRHASRFIKSALVAMAFCGNIAAADLLDSVDFTAKLSDWITTRQPSDYNTEYFDGLTMDGMYRVWKRTATPAYYTFFKSWIDQFVTTSGIVDWGFSDCLDMMHNGFALCYMYEKTGEQKYKTCAQQIRTAFNQYPKHSPEGTPEHQRGSLPQCIWLDGLWMLGHFFTNYGRVIGEKNYVDSVCVAHALHMHAFNKDIDTVNQPPWHASCPPQPRGEKWCRAIGWYVMQLADLIDAIPTNHPNRQALISILASTLRSLQHYQDTTSGLWYEVVNKPDSAGNWVELSSACMYSYAMRKGIDSGWLDSTEFYACAKLAYQAIMGCAIINSQGYPVLYGCVQGTDVGTYSYYIDQGQPINDPHGTGAWLISAEYQRGKYGANIRRIYQAESAAFAGTAESNGRGFTGSGYVNTTNAAGSHIQWTVYSARAESRKITLRYANDGTAKPASVKVNGAAAGSLRFPGTGSSERYLGQSITAALNAGNNTIRLEAESAAGCANIDLLASDPLQPSVGIADRNGVAAPRQPMREPKAVRTANPAWFDLSGRRAAVSPIKRGVIIMRAGASALAMAIMGPDVSRLKSR